MSYKNELEANNNDLRAILDAVNSLPEAGGGGGGITPTGTIQITENGTYDVTQYATAEVDVPTGGGDYSEEWIGDGNTHIWVSLPEGRTSPMLGCCIEGTVTVDWGDGTAKDTLTGTSIARDSWTPNHNYAKPGDYVITLTVSGRMMLSGKSNTHEGSLLLRHSYSADARNHVYQNTVQKIELGIGATVIGGGAFRGCYGLTSIHIPYGATVVASYAFCFCYDLASVSIPGSVTSIGGGAFHSCYGLTSVHISDGVTVIDDSAFYNCHSLTSVNIPGSVTSIGGGAFNGCYGLAKLRFEGTTPPNVSGSSAFAGIPTDCIISVPTGTLSAYTSATNYPSASTYTYIEED